MAIAVFFVMLSIFQSAGQNFGLGFSSHEVKTDFRTGLLLTADKKIKLGKKFALSFEINLRKGHSTYFGYIFRGYINNNLNIDLIHESKAFSPFSLLSVVYGNQKTSLVHEIPVKQLFDQWNKITVECNPDDGYIKFILNDSVKIQENLVIPEGEMDLFFGANQVLNHITTDIPPMNIKEIKIFSNERLSLHWPLNEMEGSQSPDKEKQQVAVVNNPVWNNKIHSTWKMLENGIINGNAQLTFDREEKKLFFIGSDSIITYGLTDHSLVKTGYDNQKILLLEGHQALFNPVTKKNISYSIDRKQSFQFDFQEKKWDGTFSEIVPRTVFYQHNKAICRKDSVAYFFGGYGQHRYNNTVYYLRLKDLSWGKVSSPSNQFSPRYLAALGMNPGCDTAYIIGGYGSPAGEQILNPDYYFDLTAYSFKDSTFIKKFDLPVAESGFCFANSLVIDTLTRKYYGLLFPKHRFENKLTLMSGSLDKSEYIVMTDGIPYNFIDIESFADLIYLEDEGQLVAITLHKEDNERSRYKIWSMAFPPLFVDDYSTTSGMREGNKSPFLPFTMIIITLVFSISAILIYKKRRFKSRVNENIPAGDESQIAGSQVPGNCRDITSEENTDISTGNKIFLFGSFQIFNRDSEDITPKFTPLLKELFLLIFLHTFEKRNINSQTLEEILWFDKSAKSAQNNRAVNMAKLRNLLNEIEGIELVHERNFWRLKTDSQKLYIDYSDLKSIVSGLDDTLSINCLNRIIKLAGRGTFLKEFSFEWLDEFKAYAADIVTENVIRYIRQNNDPENAPTIIKACNIVFTFDALNEEALTCKCQAYVNQGRHASARDAYEHFKNEYKALYGETFNRSFNEIIEGINE